MFESRDWLRLQSRYRHRPRLDDLSRGSPLARVAEADKASVEIEAALAIVVALAVAVIFEAAN